MNKNTYLIIAPLLLLSIALIGCGSEGGGSQHMASVGSYVMPHLKREGTVRVDVIVRLPSDQVEEPEGLYSDWDPELYNQWFAERVGQVRKNLLATLPEDGDIQPVLAAGNALPRTSAPFVMTVTESGLRRLISHPDVARVECTCQPGWGERPLLEEDISRRRGLQADALRLAAAHP